MRQADQLRPFLFENLGVRGRLVRLDQTWREILARHAYSPDVQQVLGQAASAGALLADNLKSSGNVHLQIQGEGALRLLLVQCDSELRVRAMARGDAHAAAGSLHEMLGKGHMRVTLDPGMGSERYQGIVPLTGDDIGSCLEGYFRDSEQLATRLWLRVVGGSAVGLMLQRLPQASATEDDWHTLNVLADTLRFQELAELPAATLLRRLFSEYDIRLFQARSVGYDCRCTREHLENVLRLLGAGEVRDIVAEQGRLEINCEFCNKAFTFEPAEVEAVFTAPEDRRLH